MKKQLLKKMGVIGMCTAMLTSIIPVQTGKAAPTESKEQETLLYPYLDTTLTFKERATDLVSRMTLDEKISQMGNQMEAIPRLGVKSYNLWSEGIHGIWNLNNGCKENTTSFPTSIAISCSWNPELYKQEAGMISDEARGLTFLHGAPLSYWSPTINLSRDPRWGRNDEGYGEDPFLTTKMGGAFVSGMQGDNEEGYLKVISTLKHFAANNSEGNRFNGSADMDDRDLYEYYTRAFKDIVEQYNPRSVMTSYNAINGTPNTVNKELVTTDLRNKWGFPGYVTSDDTALYFTYKSHRWSSGEGIAPSAYDTAQAALKAGVDTACSSGEYKSQCKKLIQDGVITEADVDRAVIRVFTERMATGEFDPDYGPYGNITGEEIEAEDHKEMALEAARESIVMLKNDNQTLPLSKDELSGKKIAVIGEFGKRLELGGYSGNPTVKKTFYDGITDALKNTGAVVEYDKGVNATGNQNPYLFNVDWFEIGYDDGKEPLKIEAERYKSANGGIIIENGKTLGNISEGSYTVYSDVDLNHMSKLRISAAGHPTQAAGGVIEVRVDSPNGPVMASVPISPTTGWQTYQVFEGESDALNYSTPQDIYVVYKRNSGNLISESALELAKSADVVLLSAGTSHDSLCKEGKDRSGVSLPYFQETMISEIARAAKAADPDKKVILSINAVGMVGVEAFKENVDAIIWSGYNGQSQGTAAADVIFGDVNPSGHLSFTWYKDDSQIPNIYNYNLRSGEANLGRTYMYAKGETSYPFGYGLSYTDFEYSNLKIDRSEVTPGDTFTVSVDVENVGDVDGKETVQLYVATPDSPKELERPIKRLNGFEKVFLKAGEKKTVSIKVDCSNLYFWDEENACQTFDQGDYEIQLGSSSDDIKLTGQVTMTGQADVKLKHATLDSDQFILKKGETAQTSLVVSMSDESFANLDDLDVQYKSNRPDVAVVDENGTVTGVGNGTALITVTVSDGEDMIEDSVAVVSHVPAELDDIMLDGVSLLDFSSEKTKYAITWPKEKELPKVTASAKDGISYEITQPTKESRRAEIAASNGEESIIYEIVFATQSSMMSDEFTEDALNDAWQIVHEDKEGYKYQPGQGFTIAVQNGDLYQHLNNANNLLVQEADGDWMVETKVDFSKDLYAAYQQAGLIVYQDDDNFIKIDYEYADGAARYLQFSREENQKRNYQSLGNPGVLTTVYFRLVKSGNQFSGYYSTDGVNFIQQGDTITFDSENIKVGMCAYGSAQPIDATFRYFKVLSDEYDIALAEAADAVERASYTDVEQNEASSEDSVRQHILNIAEKAVGNDEIQISVDTISYMPAEESTDGTYEFTITVGREGRFVTSEKKTIAIKGAVPEPGEVSKKTLEYFLDKAKEHVANGDTEDVDKTVQDLFAEAIQEGDAIMEKADATREEVMNATIKLMYAIHALDMKFPSVDKTALEMAMEAARMLELDKYVDAGKKEFSDALANGQNVLDDEDATQEEVEQAWNDLVEAMANLRLKANKETLKDLLDSLKHLELSSYTEESVKAFRAAVAKAQAVLADDTLSEDEQKTVDEAVKTLADAKAALEQKDDGDKTSNAPKTGDNVSAMFIFMLLISAGAVLMLKKREE